jgi:hypothetical protein
MATHTSKYVLVRSILRPVLGSHPQLSAPRIRTWRASTYLEVRVAAAVQSYCFTVRTDLIGPAMLTSAPPKPDGMQAVAFVPEMSHFHAQMGRIFVDQL